MKITRDDPRPSVMTAAETPRSGPQPNIRAGQDLGLARWLEHGRPDEDPVLRVVTRWWGPYLADLLAWASGSDVLRQAASEIGAALHTSVNDVPLPDDWADRRQSPEWLNVWGGGVVTNCT